MASRAATRSQMIAPILGVYSVGRFALDSGAGVGSAAFTVHSRQIVEPCPGQAEMTFSTLQASQRFSGVSPAFGATHPSGLGCFGAVRRAASAAAHSRQFFRPSSNADSGLSALQRAHALVGSAAAGVAAVSVTRT